MTPYWMIERNSRHENMPVGESVMWFAERQCFAQGDRDRWTPHADKAKHFPTKDAAEEYAATMTGENYKTPPDVTEHMDMDGPAS